MAHGLILGMTESGKSTLGKSMAAKLKAKGWYVVVLDPQDDPGWTYDYKAADMHDLLYTLRNCQSCFVFVDEAADFCGQHDKSAYWLAKKSRQWGHNCYFITHRAVELAKTMRDQASFLYLFNINKKDCKTLADEWNKDDLLDAATLERGQFLYAPKFGKVTRRKVF